MSTEGTAHEQLIASAISVDAAMLTVLPFAQTGQPMTVKGKITEVRSQYARYHYCKLMGAESQISLHLAKSEYAAPRIGDNVVAHGAFMVQPSRFSGGLEVVMKGDLLGIYKPPVGNGKTAELSRAHAPTRLTSLLMQHGSGCIFALCSNTGIEDAWGECQKYVPEAPWVRTKVRFSDTEEMIQAIRQHGGRFDCRALALIRGGGDQASLDMWNDTELVATLLSLQKPFFTALGHSTDLLLADRYADESFDTPTAFGAAAGQAMALLRDREALESRLDRLERAAAETATAEAVAKRQITMLEAAAREQTARERQLQEQLRALTATHQSTRESAEPTQMSGPLLMKLIIIVGLAIAMLFRLGIL